MNCEGKGIEGFDYICFFSDDFKLGPAGAILNAPVKGGRVSIHAGSTYYFIGLPAEDYCVENKYREQPYDRQEVIVAGYTAIKCGSPPITNTRTGIVKDGKIVINFHARYDQDSKKQVLSVFDQILATFKFIDQAEITPTKIVEGQFCGGIAGTQCTSGYRCQLDGTYPDAGGKCIKL